MSSKYKDFVQVVKLMHLHDKNDKEISECIGVDPRRVSDIRRKNDLKTINPSSGRSLYIKKSSAEKFRNILKTLLTKDTEYKL